MLMGFDSFIQFRWKSWQQIFAGKNKDIDEIVKEVGNDNVTKFVEKWVHFKSAIF